MAKQAACNPRRQPRARVGARTLVEVVAGRDDKVGLLQRGLAAHERSHAALVVLPQPAPVAQLRASARQTAHAPGGGLQVPAPACSSAVGRPRGRPRASEAAVTCIPCGVWLIPELVMSCWCQHARPTTCWAPLACVSSMAAPSLDGVATTRSLSQRHPRQEQRVDPSIAGRTPALTQIRSRAAHYQEGCNRGGVARARGGPQRGRGQQRRRREGSSPAGHACAEQAAGRRATKRLSAQVLSRRRCCWARRASAEL